MLSFYVRIVMRNDIECCSASTHVFIAPFAFISGLPDAASMEASSWVEPDNDKTVLIDASTAFRVDPDWTYGFPGKINISCLYIRMF